MMTSSKIPSVRALRAGLGVAAAIALIGFTPSGANAGFVTEQNLTNVYSANPPFNAANEITVDWLPVIDVLAVGNNANNYNVVNSMASENALFALPGTVVTGTIGNGPVQQITLPSAPTVDVFFIDSITFCGDEGANIVGCANDIPGNSFAVNSTAAAGANGTQLEGHELGHDLGLVHCQDAPASCPAAQGDGSYLDLMNDVLNGSTVLTAAQAATILGSALVQVDGNGDNYIDLQPIIFTPEPTALSMFGLGLGLMVTARSRRRGR